LDQIKLAVTLNREEELYLMDGDVANGWGTEKSFAQVLKFFMDERRGGTLQGRLMLMRMRLSSNMLGDTYPMPGCIFVQGKPPRRMGIESLAFAMAQREIEKVLDGPNAPPRNNMCYVQARDEFDFHASDIQEDFFKLEWEATHRQYIVTYTLEIRNKIVLAPIKHGKVDKEREEDICPRIFPMIDVFLARDNIDASRMRVSPSVTTKEQQDMYQHLQEMIWARTYKREIEDQLKDMPHTALPGTLKFLFLSNVGYFIRLLEPAFFEHLIHAHPFAAKAALFDARIQTEPFFLDQAGTDGFTRIQRCADRMFKPHAEISYFDSQSVVDPKVLDDVPIPWEARLYNLMEQDDYEARFPLEDPTEFLMDSTEIKGHFPSTVERVDGMLVISDVLPNILDVEIDSPT
jgi:hypothetical protein